MASRWRALWVSAVLLAVFLAPATRPGVAPLGRMFGGNGWDQESVLLLIPAGIVVAQILVVLVLSLDYSPAKPPRGDLDHLAGLKRRWAVLPGQIPGRGPRAKARSVQGGRPAAGFLDPAVGPLDTLGQLVAIKRYGVWHPPGAHPVARGGL
jgi:hypothetical protein